MATIKHQYRVGKISAQFLNGRVGGGLNPEQFLHVHRSHIVNLDFAVELMRVDDGMMVVMPPGMGEPISVSKNNLVKLKRRFGLI